MQPVRGVVWVDDETAEYGQYELPLRADFPILTRRVRKIAIDQQALVVLINPIDDSTADAGASQRQEQLA